MSAHLFLSSAAFSPADLDRLTREFAGDVAAIAEVEVDKTSGQTATGARGDPVTLGTLALAVVTSGAVTALFNIIKSYAERGVEFTFEGTNQDGRRVKVQMKNISRAQFQDVLKGVGVLK